MKKQILLTILISLFLIALASASIFLLTKYQLKLAGDIAKLFSSKTSVLPTLSPTASSTAQEIAQLQKEIDELKKQPPKIIYKTVLTPASSSPAPNLKTQEELERAKQQITSLEQRLQELQVQKTSGSQISDADLIKSWQAGDKVAQVACQNKLLGSWQLGSAVLISPDGKVLTNQHVVEPSVGTLLPDYCLILFGKDFDAVSQSYSKEYRASIAGFFQDRDAALLKIQDILYKDQNGAVQTMPVSGALPYFSISTSTPQIGDAVYVIGYPESARFAFSVTKGIISNLTSDNVYFGTDAQIDRGNSGGAALNSAGQLIGLPTWKYIGGGDYRGYILNINSIKLL